ncbi:Uncharacterized protein GBIM_18474 [Gryllus bimaculatus]|nr:Uncharacterized protein GBIM_18474 [Gryllus bimaculatus]
MSPAFTDKNYDSSTSKTSIQNETLNEKILQYEIPFGLNDSSISSDHKPHIGRKGVDATKETSLEETPVEQNSNEPTKTIELGQKSVATNVSNMTPSTIRPNNLTSNFTINSTNANGTTRVSTSSQGNLNQSTSSSTMLTNFPVSRNGIQNSSSENTLNVSELTPPKPKPEFTRDDSDVDNNSYSLTNPENDYVIPVVATIFAAPLLIVLAMFLYKRSKEFWERRHYRRMDFLIDGMYND